MLTAYRLNAQGGYDIVPLGEMLETQEVQSRLEVCVYCPHWHADPKPCRCRCGLVDSFNIQLKDQTCPKGLWPV